MAAYMLCLWPAVVGGGFPGVQGASWAVLWAGGWVVVRFDLPKRIAGRFILTGLK